MLQIVHYSYMYIHYINIHVVKYRGNIVIGCLTDTLVVNHLMYADDYFIFYPYISGGFQYLLKISSEYGIEFNVKFNSKGVT